MEAPFSVRNCHGSACEIEASYLILVLHIGAQRQATRPDEC